VFLLVAISSECFTPIKVVTYTLPVFKDVLQIKYTFCTYTPPPQTKFWGYTGIELSVSPNVLYA